MPSVPNISHEVRSVGSLVTAGETILITLSKYLYWIPGMHSEIYRGIWLNKVEVAMKTLRSVMATTSLIEVCPVDEKI